MNRPRTVLAGVVLAAIVAGCRLGAPSSGAGMGAGRTIHVPARGEWPAYAGTYASAKYSPLDQIDRTRHPVIRDLNITERLGRPFRSFVIVTKSLLLTVQTGYQGTPRPSAFDPRRRVFDLNNLDPVLSAFDKTTGALIAEIPLPSNATGSPITYMAGGKQYVAFPVGGSNIREELIAVALP